MKEAEALSVAEAENILSPWGLWMRNTFRHRRDSQSRAMRD